MIMMCNMITTYVAINACIAYVAINACIVTDICNMQMCPITKDFTGNEITCTCV